MKFATLTLAFVLIFVALVGAAPNMGRETNADRFARGLPPLAPIKREAGSNSEQYTRFFFDIVSFFPVAARHHPSQHPGPHCSSGSAQCCNSVQSSKSGLVAGLLRLLGIVLSGDVQVGLTCSPITILGSGHSQWSVFTHATCRHFLIQLLQ